MVLLRLILITWVSTDFILYLGLSTSLCDEIEPSSRLSPAETDAGEHFARGEAHFLERPFPGLGIIPILFQAAPPGEPE